MAMRRWVIVVLVLVGVGSAAAALALTRDTPAAEAPEPDSTTIARSATATLGAPAPPQPTPVRPGWPGGPDREGDAGRGKPDSAGEPAAASGPPATPNIVFILADDMRRDDLRFMPQTQRLLAGAGTTYPNAYVSLAECCPSRATILTGRYAHNTGVWDNEPPLGGYSAFRGQPTVGEWLQEAGYRTAYVGKYLNGYGEPTLGSAPTETVPGWDSWQALVGRTAFQMYGYELNVNGRLQSSGQAPEDYQTDVLGRRAARLIETWAPRRAPFFLAMSPLAPHRENEAVVGAGDDVINPRPAPRDLARVAEIPFYPAESGAFNEPDVSDKPRRIQGVNQRPVSYFDTTYRAHAASLFALDDAVARLIAALRRSGELEHTVVVFTSDNGLAFGEHGLDDKDWVYEEVSGVPLLIRGPGFEGAGVDDRPAINVDLAPTFLDLAGADDRAATLDGLSLLADPSRPAILFESQEKGYRGLRYGPYVFTAWDNGDLELYDLRSDPHQLENIAARRPELVASLDELLERLSGCGGVECRQ
jgi:N-acetylglucosamine-6-sulfatase